MVSTSALVYEVLKTEGTRAGLTQTEILERIVERYGVKDGRAIQRQITVALKRGLYFKFLTMKRNKYYVYNDNSAAKAAKKSTGNKKRRTNSKSKRSESNKRRSSSDGDDRGTKKPARKPKLPEAPSPWSPRQRKLAKEPIPRVIKHS